MLEWREFETYFSPYLICVGNLLFQLRRQTEQGLLLSMNEELLAVNL